MKHSFRTILAILLLGLAPCGSFAVESGEEACGPLPEPSARVAQALSAPTPVAEKASWLLVLPRAAQSEIPNPSDLLADGVEVVTSYWSAVLCASVSRIQGPAGAPATAFVPDLPEGAMLLPDDKYYTGAAQGAEANPPDKTKPGTSGEGPDPYRPLQYALDELGVDSSRSVTGGQGTRIAVLDSSPQLNHPDLGEIRTPARFVPEEDSKHGTLIHGILAARPNNGFGISGLVPGAEILSIPVCRSEREPTELGDECALFDVIQGLDVAWTERAQIINLSLAGPDNPLLEGAAKRLQGLGVTLVAAAGNDGSEAPLYPAAYPSVIGVGATGRGGTAYEHGNRGPGTELTAPGVDVLSTAPGGGFAFASGTSLATAHVSGALALLASASGDLAKAREVLFRASRQPLPATQRVGVLPPICDALAQLERSCPAP